RLGAVQQELRGGALFSMERKDPLLHGALRNETIDGHWPCLTNAVSAVGGLGLDGWVPPRIEVNDVVGGRQVEPCSAGAQADQEQVSCAVLERVHTLSSLRSRRRAIEVNVRDRTTLEFAPDERQVLHELAEDERSVAPFA